MTMAWFKFPSSLRNDPKFKRLPIHQRYAYIVLMCLASESSDRGTISDLDDEDLAFELEMALEDWQTLKAKFRVKGFLDFSNGEITLTNWEKTQHKKPSDLPEATKIRKQEQRARDKALKEQNVTPVTPLSRDLVTQTRLDEIRSDSEEIHTDINLRESENDFCELSGFEDKKKESPENSFSEEKKERDAVASNPEIQETPPPTPAPLSRAKISDIEKFEQKWQAENNLIDCKKLSRDSGFKKFVLARLQKLPSSKKGDWTPDLADAGNYIAAGQFDLKRRGEIELIHEAYTEYQRSQLEATQPTASSDRAPMPERSAVPTHLKNLVKK